MVNKFTISLIVAIFLCLTGNTQNKEMSNQELQRQIKRLWSTDTRMPAFPGERMNAILDYAKEKLVKYEFPKNVQDFSKTNTLPTPLRLRITLQEFKKNISSFELEEATEKRSAWFNNVGTAIQKLSHSVVSLRAAAAKKDSALYQKAVIGYKQEAKRLETLLSHPQKITSEELEKIRVRNTAIRRRNLQKQIQILEQKRRTLQ